MKTSKITFSNSSGEKLSGALHVPDGPVRAWALFAHCFTCSSNVAAASRIARALSELGIAILRFDFTGLGNSEGDFANTDFTANIEDLLSAASWLDEHHGPVQLLVGHSLGGAAVLAAASRLASVRAVATIGAPARAQHVAHLIEPVRETIETEGKATIQLGSRGVSIGKAFLSDLDRWNDTDHISALKKALLILHSPQDQTVGIGEAATIFSAAKHPKSFVSLDSADHMLSAAADARYAAQLIASWAERYIDDVAPEAALDLPESGAVRIKEARGGGASTITREISTHLHRFLADEPKKLGGAELGPDPYELLLASLGACTSITMRMYADRKRLSVDDIEVELTHSRIHAQDCRDCESTEGQVDVINKQIRISGDLSDAERSRLLAIAERCPVNKTLRGEIQIRTLSEAAR